MGVVNGVDACSFALLDCATTVGEGSGVGEGVSGAGWSCAFTSSEPSIVL